MLRPAISGVDTYRNKYDHVFTVSPAGEVPEVVDRVSRILKEERDIVIGSRPLEATTFDVNGLRMDCVFYESGLSSLPARNQSWPALSAVPTS